MTPAETVVYLAGFFDGEGTISMHPVNIGCDSYKLVVAVGQKTREPLELFQATFGGRIYMCRRNGLPWGHQWVATKIEEQKATLNGLMPYLFVKRQEAQLALNFLATTRKNRWSHTGEERDKWFKEREKIVAESKAIKKRRTLLVDEDGQQFLPNVTGSKIVVGRKPRRGHRPKFYPDSN